MVKRPEIGYRAYSLSIVTIAAGLVVIGLGAVLLFMGVPTGEYISIIDRFFTLLWIVVGGAYGTNVTERLPFGTNKGANS